MLTILSTIKSIGYWALVALMVQYCLFQVEAWRVRKSLSLHSPDLFPETRESLPKRSIAWLEEILLRDWEIDTVKKKNKILDLKVIREVDRVKQAKGLLEKYNIPYDE